MNNFEQEEVKSSKVLSFTGISKEIIQEISNNSKDLLEKEKFSNDILEEAEYNEGTVYPCGFFNSSCTFDLTNEILGHMVVDLEKEEQTSSQDENKKKNKTNSPKKKSFECSFENCGKSFDYKWILNRHINSHFCFKMFKCEFSNCEKAYKSKENLNLHIKNKHLGEKPYKCRFCTSRFSHRNGILKKLINFIR